MILALLSSVLDAAPALAAEAPPTSVEELVVTGRPIAESQAAALQIQKESPPLVSVIAADAVFIFFPYSNFGGSVHLISAATGPATLARIATKLDDVAKKQDAMAEKQDAMENTLSTVRAIQFASIDMSETEGVWLSEPSGSCHGCSASRSTSRPSPWPSR